MPDSPIAGRPPDLPEGYSLALIPPKHGLFRAAEYLEYSVFLSSGYVEPNDSSRVFEYDDWMESSFFLSVLDSELNPVGVVRVLVDSYESLPLAKLERTNFEIPDPVCEYASLAVSPERRATGVAEELYRAVWLHALNAGAHGIVALVDPWLHDLLRSYYGFNFEQLGPSKYYMGGDVRPIGMPTREPFDSLPATRPELWQWLLEGRAAEVLQDVPINGTESLD